jgi:UDP-glucuronate 4-epimerase
VGSEVLVTGAAGFIGSHLAEALVARGDRVVGIDNFDPAYDPELKRDNLAALLGHPRFTLETVDLRDPVALADAVARAAPTTIVHLAARAGVRSSLNEPGTYVDVNVRGTVHLLEAARTTGVDHLVFGSSSSVYGDAEPPFREDGPADRPASPYAATKRSGELLCHAYHDAYGIDVTCLRFFTVYGPRQRPEMAIHSFARLLEAGLPVPIFGDGTSRRDYTFVSDIVGGIQAAVDRPDGFEVYNLGTTDSTGLRQLVDLLADRLGVAPLVDELPFQPGDVPATLADIGRARQHLGYEPTVAIDVGLDRFVDWFRDPDRRRSTELAPTVPGSGS